MNLFNNKKKNEETNSVNKSKISDEKQTSFVLGVEDVFKLINSEDLVVVGGVKGTVHKGDAVYISNPGSDNDEIFLTTVLGIELSPGKTVDQATDCPVGLKIEKGTTYPFRRSTVLFTRNSSSADVHNAYIGVLGGVFVQKQNLVISDQEFKELSITDCAEILRLFSWFHKEVMKDESQEVKEENKQKAEKFARVLCDKILKADSIYCVYNKATGEPHLFSQTVSQNGGYLCTPPDIRIFTKAYADVMEKGYSKERFEIRKIENGEKQDGIYNFLGSTFYLNGACGIEVIYEQVAIDHQLIVEKPDYSNIPKQNIPVTNPDLVRWMLLIGQIGNLEEEDAKLIYRLYYHFMSKEMVKANFLIPMHKDGEIPEPNEKGETVLKKDMNLQFPTMKGKHNRNAVYMYTDWKRLRMMYDESWEVMVQPIDAMISAMDCAINATQYSHAGCYIGKEMYEDMKKTK